MILNTRHFGEIEIDVNKIIDFEEGLPGFPDDTQFVLLNNEEPFWWLQSAVNGENAFVMIDACVMVEDYDPFVDEDEIACLGEYDPENFLIYNIVTLPENVKDMTVNLLAPVIINTNTKKGKQVIVKNEDYTVRHRFFKQVD